MPEPDPVPTDPFDVPGRSTVAQIRARFDADVDRFARLETGQTAAMDSILALDLIAQACATFSPGARRLLDLGCGAGNYSLKVLERLPGLDVTLVDLSAPMLDRATGRVAAATTGTVRARQADLRRAPWGGETFDIVVAAAVLHHLRTDDQWAAAFAAIRRAIAPGGSFWIFDLVTATDPRWQPALDRQYGEYLVAIGGETYRDKVFAYIAAEDTPRPLVEQLDLLRRVGFERVEVLHRHGPFAAFGGTVPG